MPVPKMVKNGFNSPFVIWGHVWASFLPSAFSGRPSLPDCEVLGRTYDVRLRDDNMGFMTFLIPCRQDLPTKQARIRREQAKQE
jgi:hypothetical protein